MVQKSFCHAGLHYRWHVCPAQIGNHQPRLEGSLYLISHARRQASWAYSAASITGHRQALQKRLFSAQPCLPSFQADSLTCCASRVPGLCTRHAHPLAQLHAQP